MPQRYVCIGSHTAHDCVYAKPEGMEVMKSIQTRDELCKVFSKERVQLPLKIMQKNRSPSILDFGIAG